MHAPPFTLALLHPRHWPLWLGLGVMRAVHALLPWRWQLAMGEALGRSLRHVAGSRQRIVRANLAIAFPQLTSAERECLAVAHWAAMGRGLFETAAAWWASDARIRAISAVHGAEQVAALAGRGALLLTGHFTHLELGGRILTAHGVRFHAMYRPYDNPVMNFLMHRWREARAGAPALPRDELRALVKALRAGGLVWYAPDQTLDLNMSTYAPFFGKRVATITATSRLATMGRAAVLPYFPQHLGGGRYAVSLLPTLEDFPGGDAEADAARINQVLADGISAYAPAEYFWVHRRFKRVPPGEPDPYARPKP